MRLGRGGDVGRLEKRVDEMQELLTTNTRATAQLVIRYQRVMGVLDELMDACEAMAKTIYGDIGDDLDVDFTPGAADDDDTLLN